MVESNFSLWAMNLDTLQDPDQNIMPCRAIFSPFRGDDSQGTVISPFPSMSQRA